MVISCRVLPSFTNGFRLHSYSNATNLFQIQLRYYSNNSSSKYNSSTSPSSSSSPVSSISSSSSSSSPSPSPSPAPLVVIIGWLGCTPRRLNRYLKLYESMNMETIYYIPPMATFIFPSIAKKGAHQMFNRLKSAETKDRPIIFHTLSGNGVYFYSHLLGRCKNDEILNRFAGCVTDSAPPMFNNSTFTRGFVGASLDFLKGSFGKPSRRSSSLSPSPPLSHNLPRYSHPILTPVISLFFGVLLSFPFLRRYFETAKDNLLHTQPKHVSQLFIYSKADELIPWYDIETYVKEYKQMGFPVSTKCFEASPHVSHLLIYPEEYKNLTSSFAKLALKE